MELRGNGVSSAAAHTFFTPDAQAHVFRSRLNLRKVNLLTQVAQCVAALQLCDLSCSYLHLISYLHLSLQ